MDDRSPQDMMEEFVASHSLVAPWMGPANNLREVVEHHPIGPVSDYYIQPEHTRVPSHSLMLCRLSVSNYTESLVQYLQLATTVRFVNYWGRGLHGST